MSSRKITLSGVSVWLLAVTYALVILTVASIGFVVESNATQTQTRVCETLAVNIQSQVELTLYVRAIEEGTTTDKLKPTKIGQAIADDLLAEYEEVCGAPLD